MHTLQRDWRDLGFTAVIEQAAGNRYVVDFQVYKHDGWLEESGRPLFHRRGALASPDPVEQLSEAEVYLHGFVKFDGCSNWAFDEQDRCLLHACRRQELVALGEVMARCWDWAAELIPGWDGEHGEKEGDDR